MVNKAASALVASSALKATSALVALSALVAVQGGEEERARWREGGRGGGVMMSVLNTLA